VPWQALLATCVLAPLALLFEGIPHPSWSARLVLLLVYGGSVGIALPYWAVQTVNRNLPAITTALALLAVPVVGVVCSSVALGEPVGATLIMAMALIISGIGVGMTGSFGRVRAAANR
jgi:drug/metabolite transporter (DMT)-like permease